MELQVMGVFHRNIGLTPMGPWVEPITNRTPQNIIHSLWPSQGFDLLHRGNDTLVATDL